MTFRVLGHIEAHDARLIIEQEFRQVLGHINMLSNEISQNYVDLGAEVLARAWEAPKGIGLEELPLVVLFAAGIIAALYFMWRVRKPGKE